MLSLFREKKTSHHYILAKSNFLFLLVFKTRSYIIWKCISPKINASFINRVPLKMHSPDFQARQSAAAGSHPNRPYWKHPAVCSPPVWELPSSSSPCFLLLTAFFLDSPLIRVLFAVCGPLSRTTEPTRISRYLQRFRQSEPIPKSTAVNSCSENYKNLCGKSAVNLFEPFFLLSAFLCTLWRMAHERRVTVSNTCKLFMCVSVQNWAIPERKSNKFLICRKP